MSQYGEAENDIEREDSDDDTATSSNSLQAEEISSKVFVSSMYSNSLPPNVSSETLHKHFQKFSPLQAYIIPRQFNVYGLVELKSNSDAQAAIHLLQGSQLEDCVLKLDFARTNRVSEHGKNKQRKPRKGTPARHQTGKRGSKPQLQVGAPVTNSMAASGMLCSPLKEPTSSIPVEPGENLYGKPGAIPPFLAHNFECKVFVGGIDKFRLPDHVTEHHLQFHFRQFEHSIQDAIICHDKSNRSKGFGFITFSSKEIAKKAIESLHGSLLKGCKIKVQLEKSQSQFKQKSLEASSLTSYPQLLQTVPFTLTHNSLQTPTTLPDSPPYLQPLQTAPSLYTIAVGNLNPAIGREELSSLCGGTTSYICFEAESETSNKAVIKFSSNESAKQAIERLNQKEFFGQKVSAVEIKPSLHHMSESFQISGEEVFYPIKIANISPQTSEELLKQHFQNFGNVFKPIIIPTATPPYAYINFKHEHQAALAVERCNGMMLYGNKVKVSKKPRIQKCINQPMPLLQPANLQRQAYPQSSYPRPQNEISPATLGEEYLYPVKVTHLSPTTSESTMVEYFQRAGKIVSSRIFDSNTRYAKINFTDEYDARRAVEMFDKIMLDGWKINVSMQNPIPAASKIVHSRSEQGPSLNTHEMLRLNYEHWNLLTNVRDGSNLFLEMSQPFKTNPNVKVELLPAEVAIRFDGTPDAVKSAHDHFLSQLYQFISMEKDVAVALVNIFPNLQSTLMEEHSVNLSGFSQDSRLLKLDGPKSNIASAHSYLITILNQFKRSSVTPKVSITPTLLTSARKRMTSDGVKAHLCSSDTTIVVYTFSQEDQDQATRIINGEISVKFVPLQSKVHSGQFSQIQEIGTEYSVEVEMNQKEKKVYIKGYVHSDVLSAFDSISSHVTRLCVNVVPLECKQEQMQYLKYMFRHQKETTDTMLASLPALVLQDYKGKICLKGSPEDINEAQKQIMEGPLFRDLHYRSFKFAVHPKVLEQIEENVLIPLVQKHQQLVYLKNDLEIKQRRKTYSKERIPFTVTLFSNDASDLDMAAAHLELVKPCSRCIEARHKELQFFKKKIREVEQKYRVRIIVQEQQKLIRIFGLTESDTAQSEKELKDHDQSNVVVLKYVTLKQCEFVFLESQRPEDYQRLRENCEEFTVMKRREEDKVIFRVRTTLQNFKRLEKSISDMFDERFSFKTFDVKLPSHLSRMWQKRWRCIKKEKEESYDLVIHFTQSRDEERSEERAVVFKFTLYGTDKEAADDVELLICKIDTEKKVVPLRRNAINFILRGFREKSFTLNDQFTIQIDVVQEKNEVVLTVPTDCSCELEAAEQEIQKLVGNAVWTEKDVIINDSVVNLMLQSRQKYSSHLAHANSLSRPYRVFVRILRKPAGQGLIMKGSPESLVIAEPLIRQYVMSSIQTMITEMSVAIDQVSEPFFSTPEFSHFCARLRNDHCVVATVPSFNKFVKCLFLSGNAKLQICIYHGKLANEQVDAIVLPNNEDLQLRGGLARSIAKAGGSVISQECNEHIQQYGKQQIGSVLCFNTGKLPCKILIHAVIPQWMGGSGNEEEALYISIQNSLLMAQEKGVKSIALPAVGTHTYQFPNEISARACLKAVQDYYRAYPTSCIVDIRLILFEESCIDSFCKESEVQGYVTNESLWLWEDDNGTYTPYLPDYNVIINDRFKQTPQEPLRFKLNGNTYNIDFSTMIQMNEKTGHQRKVIIQPATSAAFDRSNSPKHVQWYYKDDSNRLFIAYTSQVSTEIEQIKQTGKPTFLIICGRKYTFDFMTMNQVNVETGYRRQIKREPQVHHPIIHPVLPNLPVTQKKRCIVNLRGPSDGIHLARAQLEAKVCASLKSNEITFPASIESIIIALLEKNNVASQSEIKNLVGNVSKGKLPEKIVIFKGLSDNVHSATTAIQEEIISFHTSTAANNEFPDNWQQQSHNLELFPVATGSPEWTRVEMNFKASLPTTPIRQIMRIQNKWLWERYIQHKQRLNFKNGGTVNERELFHGTRRNDPKMIYEGEDGFDMRFSAQGMWGLANYFAVNASYSDAYVYRSSTGSKQMFLVKVLTGDSYECASDRSLRLPPAKTSGTSGSLQFATARYDTVTGYTAGSHVYMTYDNDKAYPAYLIEY